jgi:hypothetical protein
MDMYTVRRGCVASLSSKASTEGLADPRHDRASVIRGDKVHMLNQRAVVDALRRVRVP